MDFDIFDLEDLLGGGQKQLKEGIKTFEDLVNLDGGLKREIYIGDIEEGLGSSIDGYIRFWNSYDEKQNIPKEDRTPIKIFINSNGGSLIETFIIINSIKMSKTPVWTIVTGAAYSGGAFSLIAGHKRFAYPNASIMFHEGSTGNSGDAHKFRNFADFYDKQLDQLKTIVLDNTKITDEYYEKNKRDDLWLTPEEAIELGVIDEICKEFI